MRMFSMKREARSVMHLLAAAAFALVLGAVEARADIIFTLSGVTFDDGTQATGTFTTSDDLGTLINYDITTVNGAIPGFNYTPVTAPENFSSLPAIIVVEPSDNDPIIQITFDGGLTATGASILIGEFDSFEQANQDGVNVHRQITGGSVTAGGGAVPEPSSLALTATAILAGLGVKARRRRAG